jgi:hypothetical protein
LRAHTVRRWIAPGTKTPDAALRTATETARAMAFELENIVPWGRSYEEYTAMFALSEAELSGRILGCGDGPASFNAQAARRGVRVISCDPIYHFSAAEIRGRICEVVPEILRQLRENANDYLWDRFPSPEALCRIRLDSMRLFLEDFARGKQEGRYLDAGLPRLSFGKGTFDLSLCSHLLFTYSSRLSLEFHLESILELCRVAREVRIFPQLDLSGRESPHWRPLVRELRTRGFGVESIRVDYEFQKGSNAYLRVFAP